ncbi:hypothetical protein OG21DRAFT_1138699 [Imleria badia]|nr:hypothetical protein OG21DRAFT_1138699 [Imleria badia]
MGHMYPCIGCGKLYIPADGGDHHSIARHIVSLDAWGNSTLTRAGKEIEQDSLELAFIKFDESPECGGPDDEWRSLLTLDRCQFHTYDNIPSPSTLTVCSPRTFAKLPRTSKFSIVTWLPPSPWL